MAATRIGGVASILKAMPSSPASMLLSFCRRFGVLGVCGTVSLCGAQEMTNAALPDAPLAGVTGDGQPAAAQRTGSVSGLVMDAAGALISGAEVRLLDAHGKDTQRVLTGADGRYLLQGVLAGQFTLTVTREGFQATTGTGEVRAGQSFEATPIVLPVAAVQVTVEAITQEALAEQQIHDEEHQRIVGFIPNFFVTYDPHAVPLTSRQKFQLAWKNASDPGNLVLTGMTAGVQQATDAFPGYSQGVWGYGRRYGADLGNLVSGTFLGGAVYPTLFHQDPRYFFKGTGTVKARLWYAVTRSVVQKGDNGRWQPAYSSVAGDFTAGALSNAYYAPTDRQGVRLTIINGFLGVGGDAINGVFQEFLLPYFTSRAQQKAAKQASKP